MDDSAIIEAIKLSGPAGAIVVVLGWMVRQWFARMREDIASLRGAIDRLTGHISKLELDLERRLTMVEAKVGIVSAVGRADG